MKSIAIDGPAGAGKSSVSKLVSKELGFTYVDTGAMYRGLALFVIELGINPDDDVALSRAINEATIDLEHLSDGQHIFLNGEDVSDKIRKEEVGNVASTISAKPIVREKLLDLQRDLANRKDVAMDGRDIGTVVLPDAFLKIFLTASVDTRTDRRLKQLEEKGEKADREKIKQDIINRDYQDEHRKIAPLKQAEDAVYLDSSDLSRQEVVEKIIKLYKEKIG